jgi:GH25 family lysozyme M1 (1,4-beta-N-acetylmuramidase)
MTKTILGIDYAGVDAPKPPNFATMKKAGMEFAILRATYGITKDSIFQRDWKKLKEAGVTRGAYMFPVIKKGREPEPQIAVFAQAIKKAGGLEPGIDLPPVFDVEFAKGIKSSGMTRLECLDWVHRALLKLEDTFGVLPMIYTSARVWDGEDDDSLDADRVPLPDLVDCPLWLARYPYKIRIASHHLPHQRDGLRIPPVPKQLGDATDVWIHQYQGDAVGFPGISSWVDLNRFFPISQATAVKGAERVKWIQRKLNNWARALEEPELKVDGDWGPKTESALREFQSLHKIPGTGIVDVRTFCALSWA